MAQPALGQDAAGQTGNVAFLVNEGDRFCPPDYRLMPRLTAARARAQVCAALQDWDIARLAGGASLGGPARNCEIYAADQRDLGLSLCVPLQDYGRIRGVLLFGGFRSAEELLDMPSADWRAALVNELVNRTASPRAYYEALDNDSLAGIGGLLVYLRRAGRIAPDILARMNADDIHHTILIELNAQTGQPIGVLGEMSMGELLGLLQQG